MKRSPMKQRTAIFGAARQAGKAASLKVKKPEVKRSTLKTKQRAVSPIEKAMWDRLAGLGCIACMKDGHYNQHVSIHHVDGRTKPGCHLLVLPLCGPHHQDDGSGAVAVHPWKARFEKRYGSQLDLVNECMALLEETK